MSMNYSNPIKKKLSTKYRKVPVQDPIKLLTDFFVGEVINLDERNNY